MHFSENWAVTQKRLIVEQKSKNHDYAAVYNNNVISYGSAFVKAAGGVPVEIVSNRWLRPWTGGGESNLSKHWAGKSLCCGYIAANKSAVCSMTALVAQQLALESIT